MKTDNRPHMKPGKQRTFEGLAVGRGIAIGTVYRHDSRYDVYVREVHIPGNRVKREQERFASAARKASLEIEALQTKANKLPGAAREELGYLLDAYQQMLKGSRLIRGVEKRISTDRINAEAAVLKEINKMEDAFAAMDDSYLSARIDDIREVGNRLVRSLGMKQAAAFASLPRNAVIVSDELSPADTALLDPKQVAGLATVLGGVESHTAIMARSLALPAVVAATALTSWARNGDTIVVDGGAGHVILNPSEAVLTQYRKRRANYLRGRRSLDKLRAVPAVTQDGMAITLQANIELPSEIDSVLRSGATGIGLLRSEFLFMNRDDLPGEEEQFKALLHVVKRMDGRPVTIRTLDIGADKLSDALGFEPGPNPALGLRAIRFSLNRRKTLMEQLAAILRAGAFGPVRILLPMVCTVEEVREVRRVLNRLAGRLKRKGVRIADPIPPLGVMIEIPGAALAADALAAESDFFAIGTNDLTQYTLAIDRTDETVAYLYNPLHPAVLRLIQFSAEAAAAAGIPVSICGEMAGDERLTPLLLGLGIAELSMAAGSIPRVKKRVRGLNLAAIAGRARRVTSDADPVRLDAFISDMAEV
ncbi:MAG: phosphoenolpyruvate--protein phosphotransferase [Alphaproteobacteria bacterium]|nr:phosphoenolpyruvate--protein phosphotransferase [Alphaproteobacteria bacterium]